MTSHHLILVQHNKPAILMQFCFCLVLCSTEKKTVYWARRVAAFDVAEVANRQADVIATWQPGKRHHCDDVVTGIWLPQQIQPHPVACLNSRGSADTATSSHWELDVKWLNRTLCQWTALYQWTQLCIDELSCVLMNSALYQWTQLCINELNSVSMNSALYQWTQLCVNELSSVSMNSALY